MVRTILAAAILGTIAVPAFADDKLDAEVDAAIVDVQWPGMVRLPIGVTPQGSLIWCFMDEGALDYRTPKVRAVMVGTFDGSPESVAGCFEQMRQRQNEDSLFHDWCMAIIPIPDPDARKQRATDSSDASATVPPTFPPQGQAYGSGDAATAAYIWRFLGWFAPDAVFELVDSQDPVWQQVFESDGKGVAWPEDSLGGALRRQPVAGLGEMHSLRWPAVWNQEMTLNLPAVLDYSGFNTIGVLSKQVPQPRGPFSASRRNAIARLDRTPREVATQLLKQYGKHLKTVMYQPALALVARSRFAELTGDSEASMSVEEIVAPYHSAEKASLGDRVSGSHLAGHLVFAELARTTDDRRYVELVTAAADYAFDEDGNPREAMPFHSEMSDAVFMACPILTAAGRFTGDPKYFEMALRHLKFMRDLCVRDDELYRHSPLNESPWGRGNGFPALGLALALTDLDSALESRGIDRSTLKPIRDEMLTAFRAHLDALVIHQDPTGMWRQVIDHPGSYRELSSTCMITFAILRGLRHGWLDEEKYRPVALRAWEAIKLRVGPDGRLFDVCTGTGKQKTLRAYLDRTAVLGLDERGGAMALMVTTEMMAYESRTPSEP
ncbi:Unsaturated rhamnogalacturonyl hydrolase YesR [Maioricimonas rarisocia]|uniref:Unsaturated rhamnogalacturonyl hydrolase YesR n=1 Tax=Maioricimonas rarisocia TaxID=2528026 RepID=A0A517Z8C6_9PLAN|nr:glycoside hydrolase family 88 protein [Maioricimonas rarisocia]QDU38713.1 Unsaturated rhamnogalacturonyl hydrolase YesR [Maioricimonas rarisocia]